VLFFLGHVKPVTEVLLELLTRVDPFRLTLEQVGAGFIRPRLGGVKKGKKGNVIQSSICFSYTDYK
jgi:hypothetical protein